VQTEEEQPNPVAIRKAMKDVVRNCIYGVDKNPLAVELCKIALWLEAYNPGEPLNFLDHHIKCGDALVGLAHRSELENGIADEAFKTLPGDDAAIAKTWRDKNIKERKERAAKALQLKAEFEKSTESSVQEAMAEYKTFSQLPETTPEEIERKAKAYKKFVDGKGYTFLKAMADTQVAQFFIPKTEANKETLMTDADYRLILSGYKGWQDRKVAKATAVAYAQRFFHWFIEFPEVFSEGGFDCVLGNPPYLGGKRISGNYGDTYLNAIKYLHQPAEGGLDFVIYFVRRIYEIQKLNSFISIITTNTISQGDSRRGGLEYLLQKEGELIYVADTIPWPGKANVKVTLFSLHKGAWKGTRILNNKVVEFISELFEESKEENPELLFNNLKVAYCGSVLSGEGFILSKDEAKAYLKNIKNQEIIKPYMNGDDLNNTIDQSAKRFVIDFKDWEEEKATQYTECFELVKTKVKPERDKVKRKTYRENWWQFAEKGVTLYKLIADKNSVIATARTSKTLAFVRISSKSVFSANLTVFTMDSWDYFAILQSNIHSAWAWKYGTTLKSDLIYAPSDITNIFPFQLSLVSNIEKYLESIGEAYHEHRKQLMLGMQLGLTKTYNLFHDPLVGSGKWLVDRKEEIRSKPITTHQPLSTKNSESLKKHLEKTPGTISLEEAIQGILKLRELHVQMDEAVLEAYGWGEASSERRMANGEEVNGELRMVNGDGSTRHSPLATYHSPIQLRHDFYEVDYLPENDRVRFTIHPDARKEVLKRLLELNHKIHEEEVKAGLWEKKKTVSKNKKKASKTTTENQAQDSFGNLFENE
jgi:hypothetical protein